MSFSSVHSTEGEVDRKIAYDQLTRYLLLEAQVRIPAMLGVHGPPTDWCKIEVASKCPLAKHPNHSSTLQIYNVYSLNLLSSTHFDFPFYCTPIPPTSRSAQNLCALRH